MADPQQTVSDSSQSALSRRSLFRAAGLATGGALLLGLPGFLHRLADEAQAAELRATFASTNLTLELEGQPASPLKSMEGGNAVADTKPDTVDSSDNFLRQRITGHHFEDILITAQLGAETLLSKWITDSLTQPPVPKNGAIVYTDLNSNVVKRLEFTNAFITDIGLPTADATNTTTFALVLLTIAPQSTRLVGGSGKPYPVIMGTKSKATYSGLFRFNVQGLEKACARIGKVDNVGAARSKTVSLMTDKSGNPEFQVSRFQCSPISILLPEADAGPFYSWFDETVLKGKGGGERAGLLEWLDPTLKTILARVQLGGLGIIRYAPQGLTVGTEGVPKVQIDMYCESINLLA